MNAGLVREGVRAHNCLVRLHGQAGAPGNHAARPGDFGSNDVRTEPEHILPGAQRHDDLFHGGVAGAFAEAVDGAFDLSRAVHHAGDAVGNRKAKVVVAVGAVDHLPAARDVRDEVRDHPPVLFRHHVADGIRDVQRCRAGFDGCGKHLHQERPLAAPGIFRGKLHVVAEGLRQPHRLAGKCKHFRGRLFELALHVNRAGGDEGVNSLLLRRLHCPGRRFNIQRHRTCQRGDCGAVHFFGDPFHRFELRRAADGEPRLDDVYPQPLELMGDVDLFLNTQRRARRLLAIPQRGVEYADY
ncbi:MAG: hypothetical protein BWY06_02870 [Candidatus Latescibacteria bacterium ADurb.Bin168]|nr:MAG: hypothetical protein BWY06_02870 [Candidatus Latescibacteria bacterium ADurb.Bin168]